MSNCVACQTEQQKKFLNENTSKNGVVIKNIYIPSLIRNNKNNKHILWVGRITRFKSPEIYLDLAKSLPYYNFKMVGAINYGDENYHNEIKETAEKIENLNFISEVSHHDIYKYYSEASLFINTSGTEGFPNTFLESWANCTPIASLNFDPDRVISRNELGLYSKDFNQLKEDTILLMENDELREKMGFNGFKYVKEEHDITKIVDKYEKLFYNLINMS